MRKIWTVAAAAWLLCCLPAIADEEAVGDRLMETAPAADGEAVRYVLTLANPSLPKYLVILMPGGSGDVSPEMQDGKLVFQGEENFLIRSRALFADAETLAVSTDATFEADRILTIVNDVGRTYPNLKVYVIGTSRSTDATMALAPELDGQVAGFVHTSSMGGIADFDTTKLKSRQLLVHHNQDGCKNTPSSSAHYNHEKFGTDLIIVEGGSSVGKPCKAFAHHGYNGIENEVVGKIKGWIRQGK